MSSRIIPYEFLFVNWIFRVTLLSEFILRPNVRVRNKKKYEEAKKEKRKKGRKEKKIYLLFP